jgi:hypothetical protein
VTSSVYACLDAPGTAQQLVASLSDVFAIDFEWRQADSLSNYHGIQIENSTKWDFVDKFNDICRGKTDLRMVVIPDKDSN